jgi:signal transduction histidine kinase
LAREFADFGRLPEGPASEVDLVELLQELGTSAVPPDVTTTVKANGGHRAILGHYEPLRRAFANLLRNAAEAMNGKGRVDIDVTSDGAAVSIRVADHGPGIAADLRSRIFEPYVTTKPDGTGLGLALVHQTVDAHRGTIAVSETPGGGATFTIVFPT